VNVKPATPVFAYSRGLNTLSEWLRQWEAFLYLAISSILLSAYGVCLTLLARSWRGRQRWDKVGLGFTLPTEEEQLLMDKSGQVFEDEAHEEVAA
jgi:hypothetical protein